MKLISCEKLEKSMVELQFSIDAETFKSAGVAVSGLIQVDILRFNISRIETNFRA